MAFIRDIGRSYLGWSARLAEAGLALEFGAGFKLMWINGAGGALESALAGVAAVWFLLALRGVSERVSGRTPPLSWRPAAFAGVVCSAVVVVPWGTEALWALVILAAALILGSAIAKSAV
jgi:hypothetical protein